MQHVEKRRAMHPKTAQAFAKRAVAHIEDHPVRRHCASVEPVERLSEVSQSGPGTEPVEDGKPGRL
jgi:hypothetical protein